jgi:hypothetical protein
VALKTVESSYDGAQSQLAYISFDSLNEVVRAQNHLRGYFQGRPIAVFVNANGHTLLPEPQHPPQDPPKRSPSPERTDHTHRHHHKHSKNKHSRK